MGILGDGCLIRARQDALPVPPATRRTPGETASCLACAGDVLRAVSPHLVCSQPGWDRIPIRNAVEIPRRDGWWPGGRMMQPKN